VLSVPFEDRPQVPDEDPVPTTGPEPSDSEPAERVATAS
jgi:hypothetical protein